MRLRSRRAAARGSRSRVFGIAAGRRRSGTSSLRSPDRRRGTPHGRRARGDARRGRAGRPRAALRSARRAPPTLARASRSSSASGRRFAPSAPRMPTPAAPCAARASACGARTSPVAAGGLRRRTGRIRDDRRACGLLPVHPRLRTSSTQASMSCRAMLRRGGTGGRASARNQRASTISCPST